MLPVHAAARGAGLGEHGMRSLGAGLRMVQQRGLEHRPPHLQAVYRCHSQIRVEQDAEISVHCGHGEINFRAFYISLLYI